VDCYGPLKGPVGMNVSKIWELSNSQVCGGSHMNAGIEVETEAKGMG
jgi:hypothetical protein